MTKEKLLKLMKYAGDTKSKLEQTVLSEKNQKRPAQYKVFLEKELKMVNIKIENAKMSGVLDKK